MSNGPAVNDAGGLLVQRLAKTDAGRAEIRNRALPLSRPARNLLLIIDNSRTGEEWLAMVQGCTVVDLRALLAAGLVAPPSSAAPARLSLAQALDNKSYQVLYDRITAEARPKLGLIKGYRMILDVERCNGPAEIRVLALRFVELVREADGTAAALALAQALVAPG